jgi:Disulphide bond corrector protein DsbC
MIKKILLFVVLIIATIASAQQNPVKWDFKTEKINETEYKLIASATIGAGWYMYSQFLASDDGPVRTSFTFDDKSKFDLIEKNIEEGHKKEGFDPVFEMQVIKFSEKVSFTQKIKLNSNVNSIKGHVNYMNCNEEMCLPPIDVNFDFNLVK